MQTRADQIVAESMAPASMLQVPRAPSIAPSLTYSESVDDVDEGEEPLQP